MTVRLSRDTVPAALEAGYRPEELRVGVVHLGLGNFHRAHQAVVFDELARAGHRDWGICAVAPRNAAVVATLRAQNHRYTVTADSTRLVGAITETRHAASEPDAVLARLADPAVRLVTLTLTEHAYRPDSPMFALLARGIAARRGAPLTVLSCDNVTDNGHRVAELVAAATDAPARRRIDATVAFPRSVVDRIVPAPTADDRAALATAYGIDDHACVRTEPYLQWVVERLGDQPPWAAAGVTVTDDVEAYQRMKLRVLNAAHSLLAYLALAYRVDTIAGAMAVPDLRAAAGAFQRREALPALALPAGEDAYPARVLDRFADPALRHTARQVAADGSTKLPHRLYPTVAAARAAGRRCDLAALTVAGWLSAVTAAEPVADPAGDRLRDLRRAYPTDTDFASAALTGPLAEVAPLVGVYLTELADDPAAAVRRALAAC
ncbi:MAG TPA: mannitol dehydrogenase family protein [Actinocatenispora sp.]